MPRSYKFSCTDFVKDCEENKAFYSAVTTGKIFNIFHLFARYICRELNKKARTKLQCGNVNGVDFLTSLLYFPFVLKV